MRRICVYCGSSPGSRPDYLEAARTVGRVLGERKIGLVYGGASVGTMGEVANATLAAGGEAIGVIPHGLKSLEVDHKGLSELHVVDTMHERKALMEKLADGFIALPGAYGTHDELFEVLAWMQLGIHRKPIGVLNVLGFFDELFAYLDKMVREGFLAERNRDIAIVDDDPGRLVDKLLEWRAPERPRWKTRSSPVSP